MTPLSHLDHPGLDLFLMGVIVAASLIAALYFLKFWKTTRDMLFLAFSLFFVMQTIGISGTATLSHPNEGSLWIFVLRLLAVLGILGAILRKNLKAD